jgi:membrane protein implicated in regulation of membrane protease activity
MEIRRFNRSGLIGATLAGFITAALLVGAYFYLAREISMISWWDVLFGVFSTVASLFVGWLFYRAKGKPSSEGK